MSQVSPTCPNCGANFSVGAKFCRACGKPSEVAPQPPAQSLTPAPAAASASQPTCPHCGAVVSADAKFCRDCGKAIETAAAQAPAVPPRARRLGRQPSPERAAVAPPPTTKKSRIGCGCWIVGGCLAVILLCVTIGVGGYLAYQRGDLSMEQILRLTGQFPPDVRVYNFRDDTVDIAITGLY